MALQDKIKDFLYIKEKDKVNQDVKEVASTGMLATMWGCTPSIIQAGVQKAASLATDYIVAPVLESEVDQVMKNANLDEHKILGYAFIGNLIGKIDSELESLKPNQISHPNKPPEVA